MYSGTLPEGVSQEDLDYGPVYCDCCGEEIKRVAYEIGDGLYCKYCAREKLRDYQEEHFEEELSDCEVSV